MRSVISSGNGIVSHPAGVRGLKLQQALGPWQVEPVAPRRGAWIETKKTAGMVADMIVAPRRGAWIETTSRLWRRVIRHRSHPAGVRGLKLIPRIE